MNPYHRAVRAALAGMERGRALQWLTAHPKNNWKIFFKTS